MSNEEILKKIVLEMMDTNATFFVVDYVCDHCEERIGGNCPYKDYYCPFTDEQFLEKYLKMQNEKTE